jgi:pimeloyl-ACP methyl ester carboxylesterase
MPEAQLQVRLHDANSIAVEVHGDGPAVLLPVNPKPAEGQQAEELRRWGVDPALGRSLIDGLADAFRVVAFDYEGHVLQVPKPDTLTPGNIVADLLAVADAAGADRFAYYGYSWLAQAGLQLAVRTDRLTALAMGGFPPLDGPYAPMLKVTTATHELAKANTASPPSTEPSGTTGASPPSTEPSGTTGASPPSTEPSGPDEVDWSQVEMTLTEAQTRQFVTLYQALQDFDDHAAQAQVRCPRLCFVGSADEITYNERWGGVRISMADPIIRRRAELESLGWQVHVLDGLDHTQAMQAPHVLPILRPWLLATLGTAQ